MAGGKNISFTFVACEVPEKEQATFDKKYEVLVRNELLGYIYLTHTREWMWDGMAKTGAQPVQSRQAAAMNMWQYKHGF